MAVEIDWSHCPIVQRNPNKKNGRPTVRDFRMPADNAAISKKSTKS